MQTHITTESEEEIQSNAVKINNKKLPDTFETKSWRGIDVNYLFGNDIWKDGENIYSSYFEKQYVLDKSTSTWEPKTWNGITSFDGSDIWSDGENIYYSYTSDQYILNKSTSTWEPKTWNGFTNIIGAWIWNDGENVYYSDSSSGIKQYILNKSTSTWEPKTWNGITRFYGDDIWKDGENIYLSNGSSQYVLDKSTSTWEPKTWNGLIGFSGNNIWEDLEKNIYYSFNGYSEPQQYILDKSTSTWEPKTWNGGSPHHGYDIWNDGENVYYSFNTNQIQLKEYPIIKLSPKYPLISAGGDSINITNPTTLDKPLGLAIKGNSVQKSILPDEYQQVEYIESTGTQYIDTGVIPNTLTDRIVADIQFLGATSNYRLNGRGPSAKGIGFGLYTNGRFMACLSREFVANETHTTDERNIYDVDTKHSTFKVYKGNEAIATTSINCASSTSTQHQILFAMVSSSGNIINNSNARCYGYKHYNGDDVLIRDFIPCYRKSDNVIGMYDIVNNIFYTNAGTGKFTKGQNVPNQNAPLEIESVGETRLPKEFQEVEYISSGSNNAYIDTGYTPNSNTSIEFDYSRTSGSINYFVLTRGTVRVNDYSLWLATDGWRYYYGSDNFDSTPGLAFDTRYSIKTEKNKLYVNGNLEVTAASQTFTSTATLKFGNPSTTASYQTDWKCWGFKIYDNGTLVRDFIPCYRKSDNVIGMYDAVNNIFYTNSGSGEFTKGSIVSPCTIPFSINGTSTEVSLNSTLKKVEDYADILNLTTGVITRNCKEILYNGETITTPYISSTGALTTGAQVIYGLSTPEIETITSLQFTAQPNQNQIQINTEIPPSNSRAWILL